MEIRRDSLKQQINRPIGRRHSRSGAVSVEKAGKRSVGFGYAKVAADFARQMIVDLVVAWYRLAAVLGRVMPPGVSAAFAEKRATLCFQVAREVSPLHTAISNSSYPAPAA